MQKIRKKYRTVKAVGPERTNARTHKRESIGPSANAERPKNRTVKAVGPERTNVRTHESEFIGSFRSLKKSGEPNRTNHILQFLDHFQRNLIYRSQVIRLNPS